jgi:hypothetical protein
MPHLPDARWILAAAPLVAAAVAGGCSSAGLGSPSAASSTGAGGSGTGGAAAAATTGGAGGSTDGGGAGPVQNPGRVAFDALQANLLSICGGCHGIDGVSDRPFLAGPDVYQSITSWPGIIGADPAESILVTHSNDPSHGGGQAPHLSTYPSLQTQVLAWLAIEAKNLPMVDGSTPTLPIFKPIFNGAVNVIYLDPLTAPYTGSSLTFTAQELGTPPSILQISELQIHPTMQIKLHVVHPLFTVYPAAGGVDPDPVDSFSGFDQSYTLADDPTLGTGQVLLANWQKDARLGIGFEHLDVEPGQGGGLPCKNVGEFQSVVVPQMQYCAKTCHAGGKAEAKAAMDLSGLNDVPPAAACSQVRPRIDTASPDQSLIFVNTDPTGGAVHMYKFMGNTLQWKAFKSAVMPWVMAEQ